MYRLLGFFVLLMPIIVTAEPRVDIFENVVKNTLAADTALIVLGEYGHNSSSIQNAEQKLIKIFKKIRPEIDCLFVEFSTAGKEAIDQYIAGSEYDSTIRNIQRIIGTTVGLPFKYDLAPQIILDTAVDLGIRIIPMDINYLSPLGLKTINAIKAYRANQNFQTFSEYVDLYLNQRSRAMGTIIQQEHQSHQCNTSIAIIGAYHLRSMLYGRKMHPLQSSMREQSIRSNVYAIYSGDACTSNPVFEEQTDLCFAAATHSSPESARQGAPSMDPLVDGAFLGVVTGQ